MFWRISFVAVFCAFVTPAMAESGAFGTCINAYFSRELLKKTTWPTPADFERIIRGACRIEELEMAKEEYKPYPEPIKGMDMTEMYQLTDNYNKERDEKRNRFTKETRDNVIFHYTKFYLSHPQ
jgi:hypothetical protein